MSQFVQTQENLCAALRKRVSSFKEDHPRLSSQQIAKRFNMSSSTLNRIENADIKKPTFDQVLKILRGTGQTEDLLSYLEEFYPSIAETYREVYSVYLDSDFVKTEIESFFTKKETFLIMLLSFSKVGCPKSLIENEFGQVGLNSMNFLIKEKAVVLDGQTIRSNAKKAVRLSQENSKQLLLLAIEDCYKAGEIDKKLNYLSFRSTNIDKDKALPVITSILDEANRKIEELLQNDYYRGSDYFFSGLVADTLIHNEEGSLQ